MDSSRDSRRGRRAGSTLDALTGLLQRSKELNADLGRGGVAMAGIMPIQRDLAQLDSASSKLARTETYSDASAQRYLARIGLDITKHTRNMKKIDLTRAYESMEPVSDMDVDQFLQHQHQLLLNTAIEESTNLTAYAFRQHYVSQLEADWDKAKREVLESLGFQQGARGAAAAAAGAGRHGPAAVERERYRSVVQALNRARTKGDGNSRAEQFALITRFKKAADSVLQTVRQSADTAGDAYYREAQQREIVEAWTLLRFLVHGGKDCKDEHESALRERQHLNAYMSNSSALKRALVQGALAYLEEEYKEYARQTIAGLPDEKVKHTGLVGPLPDVQAFLDTRADEWDSARARQDREFGADGYPVWMLVFYLVRCGEWETACQVAQQSRGPDSEWLTQALGERVRLSRQGDNERLSQGVWRKLQEECDRQNKRDPYKSALYFVLGRCGSLSADATRHVVHTTEDWMWCKLSVAAEDVNQLPDWMRARKDNLFLASLQQQLRERGEGHFSKAGRTMQYFKVLLLTQQFEAAVVHLWRTRYSFVAVHFAAALDYYGLIRRSTPPMARAGGVEPEPEDSSSELLTPSRDGTFTLKLQQILSKFVEPFARTYPTDAFHYLCLLRTPSQAHGKSGQACHYALAKLIADSSQPALLAGTVRGGQLHQDGVLFEYFADKDEVRQVLRLAGDIKRRHGQNIEAVDLFALAGDHLSVVEILRTQLARVVGQPNTTDRERLLQLARRHFTVFRSPRPTRDEESLRALLVLADFFDFFRREQYEEAVRQLKALALIPLSGADVYRSEQQYRELDTCIQRQFGDVVDACADIYFRKWEEAKEQRGGTRSLHSYDRILRDYAEMAQALNAFVGLLENVPADTRRKIADRAARMSSVPHLS